MVIWAHWKVKAMARTGGPSAGLRYRHPAQRTTMPAAAIQSPAMIQAPVAAAATPKAQTTGAPLGGLLRGPPGDREASASSTTSPHVSPQSLGSARQSAAAYTRPSWV